MKDPSAAGIPSRTPWYLRRLTGAYTERNFTPPNPKCHRNVGPGSYNPQIATSRPRTVGGVISHIPRSTPRPRPRPATVDLQLRPIDDTNITILPAVSPQVSPISTAITAVRAGPTEFEVTVAPSYITSGEIAIVKVPESGSFLGPQRMRGPEDACDLERLMVERLFDLDGLVRKPGRLDEKVKEILFLIDHV
jgi:hypothetical protein